MSNTHVFLRVVLVNLNPSVCSKREDMLSRKFTFQAEIVKSSTFMACMGILLLLESQIFHLHGCSLLPVHYCTNHDKLVPDPR